MRERIDKEMSQALEREADKILREIKDQKPIIFGPSDHSNIQPYAAYHEIGREQQTRHPGFFKIMLDAFEFQKSMDLIVNGVGKTNTELDTISNDILRLADEDTYE